MYLLAFNTYLVIFVLFQVNENRELGHDPKKCLICPIIGLGSFCFEHGNLRLYILL